MAEEPGRACPMGHLPVCRQNSESPHMTRGNIPGMGVQGSGLLAQSLGTLTIISSLCASLSTSGEVDHSSGSRPPERFQLLGCATPGTVGQSPPGWSPSVGGDNQVTLMPLPCLGTTGLDVLQSSVRRRFCKYSSPARGFSEKPMCSPKAQRKMQQCQNRCTCTREENPLSSGFSALAFASPWGAVGVST